MFFACIGFSNVVFLIELAYEGRDREAWVFGRKSTVTRRDVARVAGVSLTTVTHALNPPPGTRMAAATRERVHRAARRLGYQPSFIGRALVRRRNYTVGLLQPAHHALFRRLYQGILFGMAQAMEPADYHLLLLFRETEGWRRVFQQGRVDGVFILESDFESRHIREVEATGLPVVVVNKAWTCAPDGPVGCVQADHGALMDQAVSELFSLGRRFLVFVVDPRRIDANRRMLEGFEKAVAARRGQGVHGCSIMPDQALSLWEKLPACDGVITDGLRAAEEILDVARTRGLEAERDFSLIGTSTDEGSTTVSHQEHSVYIEQPELMGREAWRIMQMVMDGAGGERDVKVPYVRHAVEAGARV